MRGIALFATSYDPERRADGAETGAADPRRDGPRRRASPASGGRATLMENAGRAVARAVRRRFAPCRDAGAVRARATTAATAMSCARLLAQRAGRWRSPRWPRRATAMPPAAARLGAGRCVPSRRRGGAARRPGDRRGVRRRPGARPRRRGRRGAAGGAAHGGGRCAERLDGATGQVRGFAPQAALTVTFFRLQAGPPAAARAATLCGETGAGRHRHPGCGAGRRSRPRMLRQPAGAVDAAAPARRRPQIYAAATSRCSAARYDRRGAAGRAWPRGAPAPAWSPSPPPSARDIYRARRARPARRARRRSPTLLADARRASGCAARAWGSDGARPALPRLLSRRTPRGGRRRRADRVRRRARRAARRRGADAARGRIRPRVRRPGRSTGCRRARAAAAAHRCGGAAEGADTIIAAPDGRAAINASAPPWLATAGRRRRAGRAGRRRCWRQGMPAWEAACAGAWLHGRAARAAGPALVAEDCCPPLRSSGTATLGTLRRTAPDSPRPAAETVTPP